jgi:hypothetical protein
MIDSKYALRIVWIVEAALLFVMAFIILLFKSNRMDGLIELMPYLFGLIVLQGTGAIGGASLKRLTEGYKIKSAVSRKK